MGVYDTDPIIDADKTQHGNILTFGNDRNDKWAALPALIKPGQIVKAVLRITYEHGKRWSHSAQVSAVAAKFD